MPGDAAPTRYDAILIGTGVAFRLNAECIGFEQRDDGVAVCVDCENGPPEVVGSHLLLAIGPTPNTHDLGLENAGVEVDRRGVVARAVHIHPTVAELLTTALQSLEPLA